MRSNFFPMWADMSHSVDVPYLKKRMRIDQVRVKWTIKNEDKQSVGMEDCIERF